MKSFREFLEKTRMDGKVIKVSGFGIEPVGAKIIEVGIDCVKISIDTEDDSYIDESTPVGVFIVHYSAIIIPLKA